MAIKLREKSLGGLYTGINPKQIARTSGWPAAPMMTGCRPSTEASATISWMRLTFGHVASL